MRTKRATNCAIAPKCCVATLSRGSISRPLGGGAGSRPDRPARCPLGQPFPSAQNGSALACQGPQLWALRMPRPAAEGEPPQALPAPPGVNAPPPPQQRAGVLRDRVGRFRDDRFRHERCAIPQPPEARDRCAPDRAAWVRLQGSTRFGAAPHSRRGRAAARLQVSREPLAATPRGHAKRPPPGPEARMNPAPQLMTPRAAPTNPSPRRTGIRIPPQPGRREGRKLRAHASAEDGGLCGRPLRDDRLRRSPPGTGGLHASKIFGACVVHVAGQQPFVRWPRLERPTATRRFPRGCASSVGVEQRSAPSQGTPGVSATLARDRETREQQRARQLRSIRPRQFPWR